MKSFLSSIAFVSMAGMAQAGMPTINGTCPGGIEFHADEGGYVYINGKEAKLKTYSESAYDATLDHTTISITINPDGSVSLMYTAKGGANGICQVN